LATAKILTEALRKNPMDDADRVVRNTLRQKKKK
jgi:hypothetical protein